LSKSFHGRALSTAPRVGLSAIVFLCGAIQAQTNPCDLNHDGFVNFTDVLTATEMMRGQLQCTADILGLDVCNQQVTVRVGAATRSGVCVTGDPAPPAINGFPLSSDSLVGGQSGTGTITLNAPAGSNGIAVSLSSSNTTVQVPSSVIIPSGKTSAVFTFTAGTVTTTASAELTASYSGVWASADIAVSPYNPLLIGSFSVVPTLLFSAETGTGTVQLTGVAPAGGILISLSSSSSVVTLPSTVTVPQGSTSVTFNVTAGTVTTSTQVQLTATYAGMPNVISVGVVPPAVVLNWTASTSPDVAGYNIYRGSVHGGPYTEVNSALIGATNYYDSSVQPGSTYYYVTTAVNTSGQESAYSNEASADVLE